MAIALNMFEPRTMFEMVRTEFRARSFLRDRYFGNVKTFNTDAVDVDIVGPGKRKLAPFVGRRIGGTLDLRDGYRTRSFKPAYIAPFRVCTAEDAFKRAPGEELYSGRSPNDRATAIVAQDLYELDKEITRREEVMCAQALTTGKIVIKGEGVDDSLDFWAELDEADKPKATVSTLWSSASADPLADLRGFARQIATASGKTPVEIIAGSKAVDALIDRLKGDATAFNSRRIDLGEIKPAEFADGVSYVGALRLPNLDVYTYDEVYYDDETGKNVPMIPEDSILIACRGAATTRAYGLVDIVNVAANTHSFVVGDRVPNSWLQMSNPAGRIVQLKSAPLMIVNEPLAFWIVKVV